MILTIHQNGSTCLAKAKSNIIARDRLVWVLSQNLGFSYVHCAQNHHHHQSDHGVFMWPSSSYSCSWSSWWKGGVKCIYGAVDPTVGRALDLLPLCTMRCKVCAMHCDYALCGANYALWTAWIAMHCCLQCPPNSSALPSERSTMHQHGITAQNWRFFDLSGTKSSLGFFAGRLQILFYNLTLPLTNEFRDELSWSEDWLYNASWSSGLERWKRVTKTFSVAMFFGFFFMEYLKEYAYSLL